MEGGEGERAAAAVGEEKDQKPSNTCILYVNSFSILVKKLINLIHIFHIFRVTD